MKTDNVDRHERSCLFDVKVKAMKENKRDTFIVQSRARKLFVWNFYLHKMDRTKRQSHWYFCDEYSIPNTSLDIYHRPHEQFEAVLKYICQHFHTIENLQDCTHRDFMIFTCLCGIVWHINIKRNTSAPVVMMNTTVKSLWARWRLKSSASPSFTQPFIQVQIEENIKAPRHWPLCGNSPVPGEFSAQKVSNAENVSIWWRHRGKQSHVTLVLKVSFRCIEHNVLLAHDLHEDKCLSTHLIGQYLCVFLSWLPYYGDWAGEILFKTLIQLNNNMSKHLIECHQF